MTRRLHGEDGQLGAALGLIVLMLLPAVLVGTYQAMNTDPGLGGQATHAAPPRDVTSPAPPDNDCARDAAAQAGVVWTGQGWELVPKPGVPRKPDPADYPNKEQDRQYQAVLARWHGTTVAKAEEAQSIWHANKCDQTRQELPGVVPSPNPTTSTTTLASQINIDGRYAIEGEDTSTECTSGASQVQNRPRFIEVGPGRLPEDYPNKVAMNVVGPNGALKIIVTLTPELAFSGSVTQAGVTGSVRGRFEPGSNAGEVLIRDGEFEVVGLSRCSFVARKRA